MANDDTLKKVREFFGYEKLADFARDWRQLTEQDKADIKKGITDGTLTY